MWVRNGMTLGTKWYDFGTKWYGRMPWITALVEYGPSNTAHVKYGPPIDSHHS